MVHNRSNRAARGGLSALREMQVHEHTREPNYLKVATFDLGAAHRDKDLFVGFNVSRVEMPMPHRDTRLVGRERLRPCASREQEDRAQS